MTHAYENKYGRLEFEVVGPYGNVSAIVSKNLSEEAFFDIGVAEKIALITGNRGIQLCVRFDHQKMFLVHHASPSQAAVCVVTKLEFGSGVNATEVLARPNPYFGPLAQIA